MSLRVAIPVPPTADPREGGLKRISDSLTHSPGHAKLGVDSPMNVLTYRIFKCTARPHSTAHIVLAM